MPIIVTVGETFLTRSCVGNRNFGIFPDFVSCGSLPAGGGGILHVGVGWGEPRGRVTNIPGVCDPVFLILWAHVYTDGYRLEYEPDALRFCKRC